MEKRQRVYLDTNVYFRPFDDQNQDRIQKETDAFIEILCDMQSKKLSTISSDILYYEVFLTKDETKKAKVSKFLELCGERIEETEMLRGWAERLVKILNLSARDSLHIVSCIFSKADIYLTCDKELIRKQKRINVFLQKNGLGILKIMNPCDFNL